MGAKVLMMEKAPQGFEGGNSAICYQWVAMVFPDDIDRAKNYMKQMREGFETPTDEMIDAYIDEIANNQQWLIDHGAPNCIPREEYEGEFPDMEDAGSISIVTVDGEHMAQHSSLYRLLRKVVSETDNLDVWYSCRATHLIQDADKVVRGVECEIDGKTIRVRAKNGVALTCGGYENNKRMLQDFNEAIEAGPLGACFWNEGDGINMALEAGARLWHVHNYVGPNTGYMFENSGVFTFGMSSSVALSVGPDGTWYKPIGRSGHGKFKYYGNYVNYFAPRWSYFVFDSESVHAAPLHKSFDADNQWEIDHGYFVSADTFEELAELINVDTETFLATVDEFNAASENPLKAAPYYAIKCSYPCGNTPGRPRAQQQGSSHRR